MAKKVTWVKPEHSKAEINRAGKILVDSSAILVQKESAFRIMNNWRTAHSFPLNTFQIGLRRRAGKISEDVLVVQRQKRSSSIIQKLERFSSMQLARMQDLGGCRAIMPTVEDVYLLKNSYLKSDIKHKLVDEKDYIITPKPSGYRGIHLIYKYFSDKNTTYNGLQIEIQLRTQIQHSWATAVETTGTFTNQALKSSQGSEKWLRFFAVISSAFAIREGQNPVPNTSGDIIELIDELRNLESELNVLKLLEQYSQVVKSVEENGATIGNKEYQYFLIILRPNEGSLNILAFENNDLDALSQVYLDYEKRSEEESSVVALVSASSIEALRTAYPNYFLDTQKFTDILKSLIQ